MNYVLRFMVLDDVKTTTGSWDKRMNKTDTKEYLRVHVIDPATPAVFTGSGSALVSHGQNQDGERPGHLLPVAGKHWTAGIRKGPYHMASVASEISDTGSAYWQFQVMTKLPL